MRTVPFSKSLHNLNVVYNVLSFKYSPSFPFPHTHTNPKSTHSALYTSITFPKLREIMCHTTRLHTQRHWQISATTSTMMAGDRQRSTVWSKSPRRDSATPPAETNFRLWTYTDHAGQQYELYATLVKFENTMVTLEVLDGDQSMLPVTWFSQTDVQFFDRFGGFNYCPGIFDMSVLSRSRRSSARTRGSEAGIATGELFRSGKRKPVSMGWGGKQGVGRLEGTVDGDEQASRDADVDMMKVDTGSSPSL